MKISRQQLVGLGIGGAIMFVACSLNLSIPLQAHAGTIVFVGTTTPATGVNAATPLSLTGLQGGIAGSPIPGDFILVINTSSFNTNSTGDPGVSSSGYTEIADLYSNDTNDANLSVSWAFATSVPTTGLVCNTSAQASIGSTCFALVFRGVDKEMPIEVSTTTSPTAGPINNDDLDCPAVTASTTGALIVCAGAIAGATWNGAVTWPAGWVQAASSSRGAAAAGDSIGFAIFSTTTAKAGDIFNPPAFSLTAGTSAQDAWAAVSLALRPSQSRKIRLFQGYQLKIISGKIILYKR